MPRSKSVLLLIPAWAKAIADGSGNCSASNLQSSESAESSLLTLSQPKRYEVGKPLARVLGPLAFHLAADDHGVEVDHHGKVSIWKDLSGNGKDALPVGTVLPPRRGRGMPVNLFSPDSRKYRKGYFKVDHPILEGGESQAHILLVVSPTPGRGRPRYMSSGFQKNMTLFQMGSPEQGRQLTFSFVRDFRNHKDKDNRPDWWRPVCKNTWCVDFKGWKMDQSIGSCVCAPDRTTILELLIDFPGGKLSLKRRHEKHTPKIKQSQQTQSASLLTKENLAEHNANNPAPTACDCGPQRDERGSPSSSASDASESSSRNLPTGGQIDSNVRQGEIGHGGLNDEEVGEEGEYSGHVNEIMVYKSRMRSKELAQIMATLRRNHISPQNSRSGSSLLQVSGRGAAQDGDDEDDVGLLPELWLQADEAQASVEDLSIFRDSSGNKNTFTPRIEGRPPAYIDSPNASIPIQTLAFHDTLLVAERPVYGGRDGLEAWFLACFKGAQSEQEQVRFVFDNGEYAKEGYGCSMKLTQCQCYAVNNFVTVEADMTKGCVLARFQAEFGDGESNGTLSLVLNNSASLSAVTEANNPDWPLLFLNMSNIDNAEGRKPFTIGGQSKDKSGDVRWFPGYISDVQIFNRLLDDDAAERVQNGLQQKYLL